MGIPEHPDTQNTPKDELPKTWTRSRVCEHLALGSIQKSMFKQQLPSPLNCLTVWLLSLNQGYGGCHSVGIKVYKSQCQYGQPQRSGGGGAHLKKHKASIWRVEKSLVAFLESKPQQNPATWEFWELSTKYAFLTRMYWMSLKSCLCSLLGGEHLLRTSPEGLSDGVSLLKEKRWGPVLSIYLNS